MKASVVTAYGGPEVIKYQDMPDPKPGAGDVLVRVAGIGINPEDMLERNGGTKDRYRWAGCCFKSNEADVRADFSPIESHFQSGKESDDQCMNRESRHIFRSDGDRMLDEALEETFPASDPVSAEQRVVVGRPGKPSLAGRLKKETVMEGTDAAGNRMFRSSTRKGI